MITAAGGKAVAITTDVAVAAAVASAVARTVQEFERLDILVNNAAIDPTGSVVDAAEGDWDRCFAVNVKGTYLCSRAASPHLDASSGAIVNQGSIVGLVGVPNLAAYSATKGAVISLTRSMVVDLGPRGIRVNVICPGAVMTPLMEELLRGRGGGDLDAGIAATLVK